MVESLAAFHRWPSFTHENSGFSKTENPLGWLKVPVLWVAFIGHCGSPFWFAFRGVPIGWPDPFGWKARAIWLATAKIASQLTAGDWVHKAEIPPRQSGPKFPRALHSR
jgi:hypothetical protein